MSGNNIKCRREQLGLSQSQFANLSDVNFRTLQDYEQGRKTLSSARGDVLYRISAALGCSIEDILLEPAVCDETGGRDRMDQYSVSLGRLLDYRQGKKINTPFDDVFRTLATDCSALLIPVVNLVFQENYDASALVEPRQNEHLADRDDGGASKLVSDSNFVILEKDGRRKNYQVECQSRTDHSILLRLFEYATAVALEGGEVTDNKITITYPRSALIYLRHTRNTPDTMQIVLETPGGNVGWGVPVLKAGDYSIDDIFEKQLYLLVPFYLLTHEKKLGEMERDARKLRALRREYEEIFGRLEEAARSGYIDTYQLLTIRNLSKRICEHLAAKYSGVRKELEEVMGGRVLEYEAKDILRQGIRQGIRVLIDTCREFNLSREDTALKLKSKFQLEDKEVQENMDRYWK